MIVQHYKDKAPCIEGVDALTQRIVDERWPVWRQHVEAWLQPRGQWQAELVDAAQRPRLHALLDDLKQSELRVDDVPEALRYTTRVQRMSNWERTYTQPLARSLGLDHRIKLTQLLLCHRRGWFDRVRPGQRALERPHVDSVLGKLDTILNLPTVQDRITALQAATLCRDEHSATNVVDAFGQVDTLSAGVAWHVALATARWGPLGLLLYSDHPCADELLVLEEHADIIGALSSIPTATLAALRADILALCTALQAEDALARHLPPPKRPRGAVRREHTYTWWRPDLLHQPVYSDTRRAYQQRLHEKRRAAILQRLQQHRQCDEHEAGALLNAWATGGLNHLVGWRTGTAQHQPYAFTLARIDQSLDHHVGWLHAHHRRELNRLVRILLQAIDQLKLPISLYPLIDEYPGGSYRAKIRELLQQDKRLTETFASLADMGEENASARLFALVAYGGLGLLRFWKQEELYRLIDKRLSGFVYFHKLAHRERSISLGALHKQAAIYASTLQHPPLSPQVTLALFFRLPKPPYWHGGQGLATAPFHSRRSLFSPLLPQLHRAWVVVVVHFPLRMVDDASGERSDTCYALLVLDETSVLPIGSWGSMRRPGLAEVGMALYQAIWHVGAVNSPLRGVPNTIKVPTSLVQNPEDMADLHRAAPFLQTTIEMYKTERPWQKKRLVQELRDGGTQLVHDATHSTYVTSQQAHDAILAWLHHARFATHTPAEWPQVAWERGYAMPGYDSPAAGWLLPHAQELVRSTHNGVRRGDTMYTSPTFVIDPGHALPYRMYPYLYAGTERGLFVEHEGVLHYLEPHIPSRY